MVPELKFDSLLFLALPFPEYPEFGNFKILLRHAQLPHISQGSYECGPAHL